MTARSIAAKDTANKTRRAFLVGTASLGALAAIGIRRGQAHPGEHPYQLSEAEWRERLSDQEYYVLREEGTERAFTSPLNEEKRAGLFHCKGCDQALYSSDAKYDSGTGWPSFWAPISEDVIGTSEDRKLFYTRTEVHCSNCGGHLGHIFDDGPQPTGKRHCLNGVALTFEPAQA